MFKVYMCYSRTLVNTQSQGKYEDFNQQLESAAPKCWSKYTTNSTHSLIEIYNIKAYI